MGSTHARFLSGQLRHGEHCPNEHTNANTCATTDRWVTVLRVLPPTRPPAIGSRLLPCADPLPPPPLPGDIRRKGRAARWRTVRRSPALGIVAVQCDAGAGELGHPGRERDVAVPSHVVPADLPCEQPSVRGPAVFVGGGQGGSLALWHFFLILCKAGPFPAVSRTSSPSRNTRWGGGLAAAVTAAKNKLPTAI